MQKTASKPGPKVGTPSPLKGRPSPLRGRSRTYKGMPHFKLTKEDVDKMDRIMSLMDDEGMEEEPGVVSMETALYINKKLTQQKNQDIKWKSHRS